MLSIILALAIAAKPGWVYAPTVSSTTKVDSLTVNPTPSTNGTQSVGSATKAWGSLYANTVTSATGSDLFLNAPTGKSGRLQVAGTTAFTWGPTGLYPTVDNTAILGTSSYAFSTTYTREVSSGSTSGLTLNVPTSYQGTLSVGGVAAYRWAVNGLYPVNSGNTTCGTPGYYWSYVYSTRFEAADPIYSLYLGSTATTGTIYLGSGQTSGAIHVGTNASRTGAINIGNGASGTPAIGIGSPGAKIITATASHALASSITISSATSDIITVGSTYTITLPASTYLGRTFTIMSTASYSLSIPSGVTVYNGGTTYMPNTTKTVGVGMLVLGQYSATAWFIMTNATIS